MSWSGGMTPLRNWETDPDKFANLWHEFGDTISDQFGAKMSGFGNGISFRYPELNYGYFHLNMREALVIYKLITGEEWTEDRS